MKIKEQAAGTGVGTASIKKEPDKNSSPMVLKEIVERDFVDKPVMPPPSGRYLLVFCIGRYYSFIF